MRLTVTARTRLDPALRTYAVDKLSRLDRHDDSIHEARAVLEDDDRRVPRASAEVFVHLRHEQLMARCDGTTVQEAVDRVLDKIDRQIVRRKEKVKEHKGKPAAGSDPLAPGPRHVVPAAAAALVAAAEPEVADPVAARRSVALRAMGLEEAVATFEQSGEAHLLFLDSDGGEVCLLARRGDGEVELTVADTR
jgi:putative sigma-54 modulation protein